MYITFVSLVLLLILAYKHGGSPKADVWDGDDGPQLGLELSQCLPNYCPSRHVMAREEKKFQNRHFDDDRNIYFFPLCS